MGAFHPMSPLKGRNTKKIFFESAQKIPKTSQKTILGSLITNIGLFFLFCKVVVTKLDFEQLRGTGG